VGCGRNNLPAASTQGPVHTRRLVACHTRPRILPAWQHARVEGASDRRGNQPWSTPASNGRVMPVPNQRFRDKWSYCHENQYVTLAVGSPPDRRHPGDPPFLRDGFSHRYLFSQVYQQGRGVLGYRSRQATATPGMGKNGRFCRNRHPGAHPVRSSAGGASSTRGREPWEFSVASWSLMTRSRSAEAWHA
jgi:hypothetical protein